MESAQNDMNKVAKFLELKGRHREEGYDIVNNILRGSTKLYEPVTTS